MSTLPEPNDAPVQDDAVLAGTLSLMSCFVQHRHPLYAARIASNLARLASSGSLSTPMRLLCARLATRWDGLHAMTVRDCAAHGSPPDLRVLN